MHFDVAFSLNNRNFKAKFGNVIEVGGDTETAYNNGYADGEAKGYEAGQKAEYDRFWDSHPIAKGATSGENLFSGKGWNDNTFKPKYNIVVSGTAYMMFKACGITDLVKRLEERGVTLDMSNAVSFYYAFFDTKITHIGEVSIIKASLSGGSAATGGLFQASTQLHTIDKIIVNEDTVYATSMFTGCTALANITFEGVIGNNISFIDCKALTHDSLMNIINALKDFSGTTTTKTLTLHANSKALLTDTEKAIATQKGWTIA